MCVLALFEGLLQSVCACQLASCVPLSSHARLLKTLITGRVRLSAVLVLIQPRSTVFSPG